MWSKGITLSDASTEEILKRVISQMELGDDATCQIPLDCGEILRIDRTGELKRSRFDDSHLFPRWQSGIWGPPYGRFTPWRTSGRPSATRSYLDEIKSAAPAFGYAPEEIDRLAGLGFSPEELEDFLYCGEL